MSSKVYRFATVVTGLVGSSIAGAQTEVVEAVTVGYDWGTPIAAALAIGLAAFAAASAQGRTAEKALESIGRNPAAREQLFQPFILGLVFMEFQALLGFVIAILWTLK